MSDDNLLPGSPPVDHETAGGSRLLPVRLTPSDSCPRDRRHSVTVRADGAMWCRGCDQAFYPPALIWAAVTGVAVV